jgi:hypothetical protein
MGNQVGSREAKESEMTKQTIKTECGQHRIVGYSYNAQLEMVCKGCGASQDLHETNAETFARNEKAGA